MNVRFTFTGVVKIKADDAEQALDYVTKHVGMTMGRGIHSSMPDGDVDWDFPWCPDKEVRVPDYKFEDDDSTETIRYTGQQP